MRDIFESIKNERLELTRRRKKYVHEIEVLRFKYNDISKKVEQIGKPYLDKLSGEIVLPKYDPKKPPARISRLLVRMEKQKLALKNVREHRLLFYNFELRLQAKAVVHCQRVYRGSIPRTRKVLQHRRKAQVLELAKIFLSVCKLPGIQPVLIRTIKDFHKAERIRINNASRTISKNMKFHRKRMVTYRWCIAHLDARIKVHKKQRWAAHVIQSRYRQRLRYKKTLEQLAKYSNLKLEDERIALMGEKDAKRHKAANVVQKPIPIYLNQKHEYIETLWPYLHPRLQKYLLKHNLMYEYLHVLRKLQRKSWKAKEQIQIRRINRMRLENTSRLMRPKLSHEIANRPLSAAVEPDPFAEERLPHTILPYTKCFPQAGRAIPRDFARIQRFTTWNFWIEIEKLNKEFWIPELKEEDKEDFRVARSFMEWYIGESQPVRRPILVKYPKKGHSTRRITQLENAGRIYKYNGFRAKTDADLLPTEYKYIWVAPERLCSGCLSFKNENANGWCIECNLPPNYARKPEKKPPRSGNRFRLTRSACSVKAPLDVFMVHVMLRINTPLHHPARRQPFFQVWKSAVKGSRRWIRVLKQWGCSYVGDLKDCPLLDIGMPPKICLLIRKLIWHIESVINWMIDMCPERPSLQPPKRMVATDGWDPAEDWQFLSEEERALRPFTAPPMVTMQKKLKRARKKKKKSRRKRTSLKRLRDKGNNRRSIALEERPTASYALEDDSIISISEGILSNPGNNRPETSPSLSRNFVDQNKLMPALRPGTSQGLHRDHKEVTFKLGLPNGHTRPGTAPVKKGTEEIHQSNRHESGNPRTVHKFKVLNRRSRSAVRRPPKYKSTIDKRPGTVGGVRSRSRLNAVTYGSRSRPPSSGNFGSREKLASRGSSHSRGSTRSSKDGETKIRKRKKYSRPSTAPIWRVKSAAAEKIEMQSKLKEMYG
eukprot:g5864.t1